ncbi:hypothetical protein V6N13_031497 [Hibiscus sabdariffa]|uniref:Uncharacterized protein n=1 Tax=Hibiscus sabdariffa TaxID=183260 RepID=A0ABR2CK64_9ROSI
MEASNFISPVVAVNTTGSTIVETKELRHKQSDAQSDSEEICCRSDLKNPENLPLRHCNRLLKEGPNITEMPAPKSKEKASMEPWQRFALECALYSVPSDASSSSWLSYSWDSEDLDVTSLYTTLESERKDKTPASDTLNPTPTLIDAKVFPDKEAIESPEEVSLLLLSKTTDSTGFETREVSHKMSDAQEAQSDSEESCSKSKSMNPGNLPLRRSCRLLRQGPNTENLPLRRSNRLLKQGPTTTEKPVPKRKAMQAGAAPSCRRSKRIRDLKSNTTREKGSNKKKRNSH